MRTSAAAWLVVASVALAVPAAAGVETLHDPKADFGSYATYEWMESDSVAEIPEIRKYLVNRIEARLQSAGFKRVETGGDLKVGARLVQKDELSTTAGYTRGLAWTVGWVVPVERIVTKDRLIVDVVDAAANHAIWQGFATESIYEQDRTYYGRLRKKIDKIVAKMFRDFPPKPGN